MKESHSLSKKTVSESRLAVETGEAGEDIRRVLSELDGMALAQGQCVASGLFLRGGVDIGWWYRKSAVFASESLVRAYKAESRSACYPAHR